MLSTISGKAIELMITDALLAADETFGISKAVDNGEDYLNLTDDILRVIERSKEPELAQARHIMKRIRTRDLYKFVDEFIIPKDLMQYLGKVGCEDWLPYGYYILQEYVKLIFIILG